MSRRKLLATSAGALAVTGLAGCSNNQGDAGDNGTDGDNGSPGGSNTTSPGGSDTVPYIVNADTVVSAETTAQGQGPCSLQNQFLHGQKVIFRAKVIDPETGDELTGEDLSGVKVDIKSGSAPTIPMGYGPHPPQQPADEYWVAPWTVPDGFPKGQVDYSIVVEGDRSAKTVRFDIPPSSLTVLEGTYQGSSGTNSTDGSGN
ncbi:MAG: hypothetical protein ABEJ31_01820 [Haloarculaceae archaeon]